MEGLKGFSMNGIKPKLSLEGIIGLLINKNFYARQEWCDVHLDKSLDLISASADDKIENLLRVCTELEARARDDYVEKGKTIDLHQYEASLKLGRSTYS